MGIFKECWAAASAPDWTEDLALELEPGAIARLVRERSEILFFHGSKPLASLWLTLTGSLAGALGGLLVSGALWSSLPSILIYALFLPAAWLLLRRATGPLLGPAIRWTALVTFFWMFLLGLSAVAGGQIASAGWGYGLTVGFGLFIGLMHGSLGPTSSREPGGWMLTGLVLAPVSAVLANWMLRNLLPDAGLAAAALAGAAAGLLFAAPMAALQIFGWSNVHGLRELAVLYLHHNSCLPQAIDHLDRAIALCPEDPDLLNLRGIAWSRSGDTARAEADWAEVRRLAPRDAAALMNRGVDLIGHGAFDEAVLALEAATELDPGLAMAHSNLGVALERKGEFERALVHYSRAIELRPNYPRAHSNRAYCQFRAGRLVDAVADCDRALELDPNIVMAYVNRAHAFAAMGDYEAAAQDYQIAFEYGSDAESAEAESGLEAIGRYPD